MTDAVQPIGTKLQPRPFLTRMLTVVLRHPVVMLVKRPLRNAVWSVKRTALRNPPIPHGVRSMLFVCFGNICRSPFAAQQASRQLDSSGNAHIVCDSAGTHVSQAARSPKEACAAARRFGLSLDLHVPQLLTRELMERFDLIVVMEADQFHQLRSAYPGRRYRILLLSLFDGDSAADSYERCNLADPYGQPLAVYDRCYRRIERAVGEMISAMK